MQLLGTVLLLLLSIGVYLTSEVAADKECHTCNSFYDDNCGESIKKGGRVGKCGLNKGKEAVACRKMKVDAPGTSRWIRDCVFNRTENATVSKLRQTGSTGVVTFIWTCTKDKCNGVAGYSLHAKMVIFLVAVSIVAPRLAV